MKIDNSFENKVGNLVDKTFANDQQKFIQEIFEGLDLKNSTFNQKQMDAIINIVEAASKRATKASIVSTLVILQEEGIIAKD